MQFFLTNIISTLGRYTILLLLPVVGALALLWFQWLDHRPILAFVLAAPVFFVVLGSLVLVLGILLSGTPSPEGITVSPDEAPELWNYWNEVSPPTPQMRRQIIVTNEINAAMAEHARFAGLFGRDQTLFVGAGLLITLDRPAIEAILEHEFAHAELKHSHGLTRLNEFYETFEAFENYVEYEMPLVAMLLSVTFYGIDTWLKPEMLARSQKHEFEADQQSADRVGTVAQANALMLVDGVAASAKTLVYDPLDKEMRGAVNVPEPPLDRLIRLRDDLVSPETIRAGVEDAMKEEPDPASTHPPLAQRLANINASPDIPIRPIGGSAFSAMLPEQTQARLMEELNKQWSDVAKTWVEFQ